MCLTTHPIESLDRLLKVPVYKSVSSHFSESVYPTPRRRTTHEANRLLDRLDFVAENLLVQSRSDRLFQSRSGDSMRWVATRDFCYCETAHVAPSGTEPYI